LYLLETVQVHQFQNPEGSASMPDYLGHNLCTEIKIAKSMNLPTGRKITGGQRTMSGQNAESSGQILTLPVILTGHFR
jgi:hypothetical protein